jgi:hypothetical protein
MILLMMTTDGGGAREDGNIYYATPVLVDVEDTVHHREQLARVLCDLLSGDYSRSNVTFADGADDAADWLFNTPDTFAVTLSQRGFPAVVTRSMFVVQEQR